MVKVPVEADVLARMVAVDVPLPVTEEGLRVPVTPEGKERAASDTLPVKPLSAVTVTV
jgi:hypothetical protein